LTATATAASARTTPTARASTPSSPGARPRCGSSSCARSSSRISRAGTRWRHPLSGTWPNGSGRPRGIFDLEAKQARVAEIDALTQAAGFWDDGRSAQKVLREADGLRAEIATWQDLETRAQDLLAAVELLQEAPDAELETELDRDAASLQTDFQRERTALLFSGEYDERPALLSISAGAGGTEATDWTEMLLRMYLRWAERHRFKTEILDQQEGEQAGLKSVTVAVEGRRAYGWLRAERGVHRLVRISPFDSQNRRQTTFALVEVLPEADDDVEIELDWDEIRVDTYRSQGAGGQHVNKTDSAVRLTHLPTGIVAQSQNERSQTQNKEMAVKVLKSRLLERALEEKEEELRRLKGEHVEAGWGNQIRSYVLHPYQMVKDLRTGYETGNTNAVLDGDLDAFMQAELERNIGEEAIAQ
jgi:peptide chain release factor 2